MNKELAEDIKYWRCIKGATWRRVAEYVAENYPGGGCRSGNQIDGADLCKDAAELLHEDCSLPPWN